MSEITRQKTPAGEAVSADVLPVSDLEIEGRRDFILRDGGVRLIASRSVSSGSLAFPQRSICQVTGARDLVAEEVGPGGTLYSYSTVHVSSTRQTPYTLGYVDFDNGLRVLAEVRGSEVRALACDIPVRLVADDSGWWVEPAGPEGAS